MSAFRAAAGLLMAALLLPELSGPIPRAARPRNLLLVTLDTMRADRLSVYGFAGVQMPALERIAREGTVFEEAFAAVPLTLPSHSSMMTGLYPPRLTVRDNAGSPLSNEFTTLAELLRAHGLSTAAFVASSVVAPGRGLEQGFDRYSLGESNRCPGMPVRRRANEVVDEALTWLREHDSKPFFTWVHLFDTHRPYDLPPPFKDQHFDPYIAAIQYEDSQIARLLAHLQSRGLLDTTLIVVIGDHGESLGGHGEDAHGIFVYQEALRVPFLMRGPGVATRRPARTARVVDVMPTVLDGFGVPVHGIDGVSLHRTEQDAAPEVYAESMYPLRFGWAPLRTLRADRYKFIAAPRAELYDLTTDPAEERNVIDEHPKVAEAMRRRLQSFDSEEAPAAAGEALTDRAVSELLASLGYIGSSDSSQAARPGRGADPKDHIADFNRITARHWQRGEQRGALCTSGSHRGTSSPDRHSHPSAQTTRGTAFIASQ